MIEKIALRGKKYLSELWDKLPNNVLLDKGITGCGGTYVELNSKRNSIILAPTKELVRNKEGGKIFGITGDIKNTQLKEYLESDIKYKKIIGTYDSLPRIMNFIDPKEWFLLVDEYHILFNQYSLRNSAIYTVLNKFKEFGNYCFMTATPLKDSIMLEELKDLKRISLIWEESVPVSIDIIDTRNTVAELSKMIENPEKGINYHMFVNSVSTINRIIKRTNIKDYKVVCSDSAKSRTKLKTGDTTSPIKKFNFYTATAFEGCDIYDPKGKTIILCDTNIATTMLDISTLVRQISGRIRDSIYKDSIKMFLNTSTHRYAGITDSEFRLKVKENTKVGKRKIELINSLETEFDYEVERRSYSEDTYSSFYVNYKDGLFFFDKNLKKRDIYNYMLINEIYNNSINVMMEVRNSGMNVKQYKKTNWAIDLLEKDEYTYKELEAIFSKECIKRGRVFNGNFISEYFEIDKKYRKMVNGKRQTYYKFKL